MSFFTGVLDALKVKSSTLETYDEDKISEIIDRVNDEIDRVLRDKEFQEEFDDIEEARDIVSDIMSCFDAGEYDEIKELVEELEEKMKELD